MALKDFEIGMLKNCCDANESIIVTATIDGEIHTYRSRFLEINLKKKYMIIDEPSAENSKSRPLSNNQNFEAFFKYNVGAGFRYIFNTKVISRVLFKVGNRGIYAFQIVCPTVLLDGERRDYFRVPTDLKPEILVNFTIYKEGEDKPLMNQYIEEPEVFSCAMIDISGGGYSLKSHPKGGEIDLGVNDSILGEFKFEKDQDPISLWAKVRNKRKYQDTNQKIWGLQILDGTKNKLLKPSRSKILRFVSKRQREILS